MVRTRQIYVTSDGSEFQERDNAEAYEESCNLIAFIHSTSDRAGCKSEGEEGALATWLMLHRDELAKLLGFPDPRDA